MRRLFAVLLVNLALMAMACGDKCPAGYVLDDGFCRKCRAVEGAAGNVCVVGDASILTGEADAGSDGSTSPDERYAGNHSPVDGSEPAEGETGDGDAGLAEDGGADDGETPSEPGDDAMSAIGCASAPCQHDSVCTESSGVVSCACAGSGFEGPRCEDDVNECMGSNVCSGTSEYGTAFSLRCTNETPYYRCEGQFPDWPIQDPPNRFSKGIRIVEDAKTGLQWEQAVGTTQYTWDGAKEYCAAKGDGWRVPSKAELESIIDDTRVDPAIDADAFPNTPSVLHWTSTPQVGIPAAGGAESRSIWAVQFRSGAVYPQVFGSFVVRCVRARP